MPIDPRTGRVLRPAPQVDPETGEPIAPRNPVRPGYREDPGAADFDIGKHGGGTPTADNILALAGPQQSGAPDLGAFGDMSDADWAALSAGVDEQAGVAPPAPLTQDELNENQFGNDMAWLDPLFQEKQVTTQDALQYGTSADPQQEAAQKQAIGEMFGLYQQGGRGAQDRAARAKNRAEVENLLYGQNQANLQDMSERGMGGSGAELASALGATQAAGSRLSQSDLQDSADAEQRALSALMGGQQAASGLQSQQNQYVQNNADMIQQAANSNAGFLRQAYSNMIGNRSNVDLQTFLAKLGVAGDQKANAIGEQQYGYSQGGELAGGGADTFNQNQNSANQTPLSAFTGTSAPIYNATQTRIGLTGGTQAAAGRSASGGAKFVGDFLGNLYGGKGGGGGGDTQKKQGATA